MAHIVAELRSIYSIDFEIEHEFPGDPESFEVRLDAEIGAKGASGADLFSITVCTPVWLATKVINGEHVWGSDFLIVERWDYQQILLVLRSLCERTTGPDWKSVAHKLSHFARWEFDGSAAPTTGNIDV